MRHFFLFLSVLIFSQLSLAQPFRYIKGNEYDRDSIKLLKIHGFKEYTAVHPDTNQRILSMIVEYDTNGNLTRKYSVDLLNGKANQWTYKYSPNNLLLEYCSFYPDSLTMTQRVMYKYDNNGNQIQVENENYFQGKISSSNCAIMKYNRLDQLIALKKFDSKDKLTAHYEYVYDDFGNQIEELVYSPEGKLMYRRDTRYQNNEIHEMYGLPMDDDLEINDLLRDKITYRADGSRIVENGYDVRVFDKNNLLLKLTKKNYKYHWYEYSFY